jgi:hypothetical protein
MPLLLLNATSVDTGRRVIASELQPTYPDGNGQEQRVFPEAYDLFEELPQRDIPLSTQQSLAADSLSSHPMGRFGATIHGVRRNAPLTVATSRTTA